jgi:L-malate glycosyltransferase
MSRRSPRVLQVVLSLNAGGTERLVVELARRLNRDVPTAVCCLDEAGTWSPELVTAGVEVHPLHRAKGFVPGLGRAIAGLARQHCATVVHCHHYSPFVYGALARLWYPSLRVIYTEHGRLSDAAPSAKRRLANVVLGHVPAAVFAVSNELRQYLIAQGLPASRTGVIYNGIDPGSMPCEADRQEARRRLGACDRTLVIGSVARLDPVKDLGSLIRAVALLSDVPVLLAIIGDGPERDRLMDEASDARVTDRVRFLGHRNDARAWLPGCDIYANSSISEGVSLTILEAMAAGLPVVATGVGGTPEVVDSASGTLVPSRDPQALADALAALYRDDSLRRAMGRAARGRVEERFTLVRMVQEYQAVYERLT